MSAWGWLHRSFTGALVASVGACASGAAGVTAALGGDPAPVVTATSGGDASVVSVDSGVQVVLEDGAAVWTDDAARPGTPTEDAATPGVSSPAVACLDDTSSVYVTPPGLSPMTMAARGTIVRCAFDSSLSLSDVASELSSAGDTGVTATSSVNLYRIAYRTYRDDGVAGVSTARVYLPTAPAAFPLPVVAVGHPTDGLAAGCAPSTDPTSNQNLALPWAANGYAVIVSDFAGLGNEGVQGYADNHDEAHSLLDSARALRALLQPAAFGEQVLLVGYSQGGGAALAAQGLVGSYGAGGNVAAVIVFAAEYFSRLNSFSYVTNMSEPSALTISTGISMPVVAAMRDFAFGYNVVGPSSATTTFPASIQSGMQSAVESLCQTPFGGYLQGAAPHVGDIYDPTFSAGFLACVNGTSGCTGLGSTMYDWLTADLVPPDPAGAPVLYIQGLADVIMPPAQEAACNIASLQAAGVSVQVCVDPPAQHTNVPQRNAAFALQWGVAKLGGGELPTCSSTGMPACSP
jgi:pimeloyl-ACP methyl ester carboxylesterase